MLPRKRVFEVEFDPGALRVMDHFPHPAAREIVSFIADELTSLEAVRSIGIRLKGSPRYELYKFRFGRYRIVGCIDSNRLFILTARVGSRRDIYY